MRSFIHANIPHHAYRPTRCLLILASISAVSSAVNQVQVEPIIPHITSQAAVRSLSSSLSSYNPRSFGPVDPQAAALTFARSQLKIKDGDYVVTNSYKTQSPTSPTSTCNKPSKALRSPMFDASKVTITPRDNAPGGQSYLIRGVDFVTEDISVTQSYIQATSNELVPVWEYTVKMPLNYFHVHVSADGKTIVSLVDLVRFASYRVNKFGNNNPIDTPRQLVTNPADPIASPNGWHTQGNKQFTTTIGNNAIAQENYSGSEDCKITIVLMVVNPKDNINAAITNLFYVTNSMHDLFYRYGFDEAAGNFQEDNGNKGGKGGDAVAAFALDSYDLDASDSTRNNAMFMPAPDGTRPKILMFGFDAATPNRDGDFENDIISHEYGHGVSNRLTGGPSTTTCLNGKESLGMDEEMKASDKSTKNVITGKYVVGRNIRHHPYSTDLKTNPTTYGYMEKFEWRAPHEMGEVWANMLYEMYWNLVNKLGFQEDKFTPNVNKGNTLALQLVVDGLKLQPCNPTFVMGRDAILEAEQQLTKGEHSCDIWRAFAKRGLGYGASVSDTDLPIESTELPTESWHYRHTSSCIYYTYIADEKQQHRDGLITSDVESIPRMQQKTKDERFESISLSILQVSSQLHVSSKN
ncbi:Fungalysin metallopeptidase-domain-containing protein [Syncephalis plumigaleata]|nr:Fungalysin metallopeptidase-domain-containing protein [Syncephalis plumigaleata]